MFNGSILARAGPLVATALAPLNMVVPIPLYALNVLVEWISIFT